PAGGGRARLPPAPRRPARRLRQGRAAAMMRNRRAVIGLAGLVAVGILGWGGWAWYRSSLEVSTDDAYVEGTISPVSANATGHIVELRVNDNQAGEANEILLPVDPRHFAAQRDQ